MKKALAIVLALVIALSCSMIAFAVDVYTCPTCGRKYTSIDEYNDCIRRHEKTSAPAEGESGDGLYECKTCGKKYDNIADYNACVDSHFNNADYLYEKYISVSIQDLIGSLVDTFNKTGVLDIVKGLIENIVKLIEGNMPQADVAGAVSDLESKIGTLDLGGDVLANVKGMINGLKQKIKDLYSGEAATVVEESTAAEEPAQTGSASAGIAAFAAISVAAAAVFVCAKKKD